ncbi:T9SS C-terminal target domain-containing protein [Sphingobacteriales bacterium UPWRP_1]|nr:hypothetical protein B6N25_12270 [Sphingobacteriales bacterium TSM_CSS]PSJ77186.1 T9SS C-terminal target domain-containing protein [Sphingobacteriales bacterium UPWRP_1]
MKTVWLFLLLLICFEFTYAQDIPNPGFENWVQYGGYKDPEGWFTINSLTVLGGLVTVTQATGADAHSGQYAMRLRSGSIFGQVAPGIAATGSINPTTQDIDGGVPYTQRPLGFSGWYKYEPQAGDTATIAVNFTRWNPATQQTEDVGECFFFETQTVGTYTQFWAPVTYFSEEQPDTMVIVILSSSGEAPVANSTLYVDDLAFNFEPLGLGNLPQAVLTPVYPLPAAGSCNINNAYGAATAMQIANQNGQEVLRLPLAPGINRIDLETLPSGLYYYRLTGANNQGAAVGKLPVIH